MPERMKKLSSRFRRFYGAARFIVVIALFALLFHMVKLSDIAAALKQARPQYLVLVLLLLPLSLCLQVLKWNYILGAVKPKPPLKSVIVSLFGGFFLGAVSPARSGEIARGFLVPGHSRMKIASLTLLEKGLNQAMIYSFGLIALVFLLPQQFKSLPIFAEILLVVMLFNIDRLRPYLVKIVRRFSTEDTARNSLAAFEALSAGKTGIMLFLSLIFYLIYSIQYFCLFLCFTDLAWQTACKTIPVIYLVNVILPISVGDLGVKEMTSIKLLAPFGIAAGAAFSASLTQNLLTFIIPSIIGGVMIAVPRLRPHREALPSDDYTVPESGK
jgi:uncharacterized protein (TIRG00374 family)